MPRRGVLGGLWELRRSWASSGRCLMRLGCYRRGGRKVCGQDHLPHLGQARQDRGLRGAFARRRPPKYLNSPETEIFNKRDLLYGFPQVSEAMRKERAAIIVEGYTDVLMLYQSGIRNAVATLGTATTPSHLRTLSGYAEKIYMLFDPDTAGEKALERADATVQDLERTDDPDTVATATRLKLDLRVLRLTQDPADWLLDHSPEEFAEMLSGAVTLLEYIFRRKVERARGASAAERSRMMSEVRGLISRIDDPVFYREALRVAAEAMGVSLAGARERKETAGREGHTFPARRFSPPGAGRTAGACLAPGPPGSHREATGARRAGPSAARALQTRCQRLCD